jgi:hypothetical protein
MRRFTGTCSKTTNAIRFERVCVCVCRRVNGRTQKGIHVHHSIVHMCNLFRSRVLLGDCRSPRHASSTSQHDADGSESTLARSFRFQRGSLTECLAGGRKRTESPGSLIMRCSGKKMSGRLTSNTSSCEIMLPTVKTARAHVLHPEECAPEKPSSATPC